MVCWKLFEARRGVHQEGVRTPQHWRIRDEAVATPHHTALRHVTRGYNAVQNGRETPRKYSINWQGAYLTNLELRYAVSSPPPTLNGDHLNDMVLKRHQHWGVGGGRGANIVHALGPVFPYWSESSLNLFCTALWAVDIQWNQITQVTSVNHRQPTVGRLVLDLPTDRPSTDRWSTGARLTNR